VSVAQAGAPAIGNATGTRHRTDIQGPRAVAVLLVVFFHAHLGFSGGFVGVDG
jgi:peptidoglycan/LPS O-acetylase OafA/YrhL